MNVQKTVLAELGLTRVQEAHGIVEYKLDANGLKILLAENHSKPVVTFMGLFHVGSRNEGVGYTGSTHFLEHLMFKGTPRHNPQDGTGVMEMIKPLGSMLNATTWIDRTNYFECVPAEHLELCIELEADRMRNLNLRQEDRDSEMTVVRNEMERAENNIDRVMRTQLYATAFREHPYHHPTLGWKTDVEGVPLERFVQFYNDFYWPNNCTVLCVGDFDAEEALRLIVKHYGKIPASPKPIPTVYTVEPPQEGERRFEIRRAGDSPRITIGFHIPEAVHADTYALSVLGMVLGNSGRKTSRLYKRLVMSGLAVGCSADADIAHDPSLFTLDATVAPGAKIEEVEAALLDELAKTAAEVVSEAELKRAKSANRKSDVLGALDPMNQASMLAQGEAIADWRWLLDSTDAIDAVTADDVRRVASTYFGKDNRTVGHFIPEVEEEGGEHDATPESAAPSDTDTGAGSDAGASKTASFASQVVRKVLSNGLTISVMSNPGSGAVSVAGRLKAGDAFASDIELVPTLVSFLLTGGTKSRSQDEIASSLEEMAARLRFNAERFDVSFGTPVVKDDLPSFLALLADVLRNPTFPAELVEQAKRQWQAFMMSAGDDTDEVAGNALAQAIYSDGPFYDKPFAVKVEEMAGVTSETLAAFHSAYYSPKGMNITIVGDIDADAAFELVEKVFGDWTGADKAVVKSDFQAKSGSGRVDVKLVDKKNASILIGVPVSLDRKAPDFYAAKIANAALGGDTITARLGKVVRVKHGLTYGINSSFADLTVAGGPWTIELTVNPAVIDKALGLVKGVVDDYVENGISEDELKELIDQAANGFIVSLRSDMAVAATLAAFEAMGMGAAEMDSYAADVKAVTKEAVDAAIRKYFRLEEAVTVVAGTF